MVNVDYCKKLQKSTVISIILTTTMLTSNAENMLTCWLANNRTSNTLQQVSKKNESDECQDHSFDSFDGLRHTTNVWLEQIDLPYVCYMLVCPCMDFFFFLNIHELCKCAKCAKHTFPLSIRFQLNDSIQFF